MSEINEDNCVLSEEDILLIKNYFVVARECLKSQDSSDGIVTGNTVKNNQNKIFQKITKLNDLAKEKKA